MEHAGAALAFKPDFLTHEFLAGRRARYLPPVRLYLVLSVLFFLCASLSRPQVLQLSTSESGVPKAARVVPLDQANDIPGSTARPGESPAERNARECAMINFAGPLDPAMQKACPSGSVATTPAPSWRRCATTCRGPCSCSCPCSRPS